MNRTVTRNSFTEFLALFAVLGFLALTACSAINHQFTEINREATK